MGHGDLRKVSAIFEAFDLDEDARLNKAELEALIQQCNPTVSFSEVQLQAIIDEVLEQYEGSADVYGLTRQSLAQLYMDGIGDCDLDFHTLQLEDSETQQEQTMLAAVNRDPQQPFGANFSDLFDQSPGVSNKQTPSIKSSFGLYLQGVSHDENTAPNISPSESLNSHLAPAIALEPTDCQASQNLTCHGPGLIKGPESGAACLPDQLQQLAQQEHKHTARHRHKAAWGTLQPAQGQDPASRIYACDGAQLTVCTADQKQQEQSCGALVDELEHSLRQERFAWKETADALRQQADSLNSADCYDAHMEMGILLTSWKHHEEAMKCFQHASVAAPGDARPLLRLGNALFALHQLPRSQEAFRQALTAISLPDDAALLPKIHVNLGISLEAAGHLQAACQHYRDALQLSPQHFRALKLLGSALYAQGDLQGACTALQSALQLQPSYADAHCDLGCALCALGEVAQAKEAFGNAAHLNPQHVEALYNLGNLHRQSSEYQAAIQCYDSVLALNSQHWRSMLNKAVALMGLHEDRAAQLALKQAFTVSGERDELLHEVASLRKMAQSGNGPERLSQLLTTAPPALIKE